MTQSPAMTPAQATAELHRILLAVNTSGANARVPGVEVTKALIDAGADIHAPDSEGLPMLLRVLSWPCTRDHEPPYTDKIHHQLDLALFHGADVDAVTPDGKSALDLAAAWADNRAALQLIDCEVYRRNDPVLQKLVTRVFPQWPRAGDAVTGEIKKNFMIFCHHGNIEAILYYTHLWPDAVNWHENKWAAAGGTGLIAAINHGGHKLDVAQLLVSLGCDLDWQDDNGMTALMRACTRGNFSDRFIPLLVDAGANTELRSKKGETALDLARATINVNSLPVLEDALRRRAEKEAAQAEALSQLQQKLATPRAKALRL